MTKETTRAVDPGSHRTTSTDPRIGRGEAKPTVDQFGYTRRTLVSKLLYPGVVEEVFELPHQENENQGGTKRYFDLSEFD
jgi:hypothetical protein